MKNPIRMIWKFFTIDVNMGDTTIKENRMQNKHMINKKLRGLVPDLRVVKVDIKKELSWLLKFTNLHFIII